MHVDVDAQIGAHPRVGGENNLSAKNVAVVGGSSPRGRGKQVEPRAQPGDHGLIPAWAGKTPP